LKFMDASLLQQFRQQLASWIEARLESQRLPFQRLELSPRILTDQGRLVADMVLWINRDSQLAGTMILLPDAVDTQVLADGASLAKALGLGHFTTWAAREVTIWTLASGTVELRQVFKLPPANRITPENFQHTLQELLEQLKIVTITSAPVTTAYTVHYFANLCLRNLEELTPGLTISARITAGQTAADEWLEQAPREKAWLSLWRILHLLREGRLPPGLQPERLELALHYALTDLANGQPSWLSIQKSEPPLPEGDAVRLHHLASRLRQLGWPVCAKQANELICLLLSEAGHRFGLKPIRLPWVTNHVKRWVGCQPLTFEKGYSLVAPRAYLAGWALQSSQQDSSEQGLHAESVHTLDVSRLSNSAVAVLQDTQPLVRKDHDARLILLRQAWPSRRFDLPRNAPTWLWDALYLAGLTSEDLSLTLPQEWYCAPGILSLWSILGTHFQLTELAGSETGEQSLHFVRTPTRPSQVLVHRSCQTIEVAAELLAGQPPGTAQVWLKTTADIADLLSSQSMTVFSKLESDWSEALTWGIYLFLHTRLGGHLWDLCSGQPFLPEFKMTALAVQTAGVPVPSEIILKDLSLLGDVATQTMPDSLLLEQEFANIFGSAPNLPDHPVHVAHDTPKTRRRSNTSSEQVAARVFIEGVPRFPEHYLMHVYRPKLVKYDLFGPLEIIEEFFDRISMRTIAQEQLLEVSGRPAAEALVLASYTGEAVVSLPEDDRLLAEVVMLYRSDLLYLWNKLARECRRSEPHRQTAAKMARKIWEQHGLPPESVLKG
jgi:hypothetical protein